MSERETCELAKRVIDRLICNGLALEPQRDHATRAADDVIQSFAAEMVSADDDPTYIGRFRNVFSYGVTTERRRWTGNRSERPKSSGRTDD